MKATKLFNKTILSAGLALVAFNSSAFGQGALTPSAVSDHLSGPSAALNAVGLPQPTMKTLQQVEPRVDVQTLESDGNVQYVIDKPGSYYLSENIKTSSDIAISVQASCVTLDLNGFHVTTVARNPAKGIQVANGLQGVTIRNGKVSGFSVGVDAFGIATNKTKGCVVENLRVADCTSDGILVGESGIVRHCVSIDNGNHGIFADNGSLVTNSVVCGNGASSGAIWVRNGCTVSQCVARSNQASGIVAGLGCNITACTASENNGTIGISAGDGSTVSQCIADRNVGAGPFSRGISVESGCTVVNSTARGNDSTNGDASSAIGVGIRAGSGSLVKGCTIEGNKGDAIRCESNCRIEQNTCIDSGLYGAGVHALGDNNRIDGNHCTANRYGIRYDGESNLVIRNSAYGNGLTIEGGNFSGDGSVNGIGPFIYMNDINDAADDRPWGNFTKTPQISP